MMAFEYGLQLEQVRTGELSNYCNELITRKIAGYHSDIRFDKLHTSEASDVCSLSKRISPPMRLDNRNYTCEQWRTNPNIAPKSLTLLVI